MRRIIGAAAATLLITGLATLGGATAGAGASTSPAPIVPREGHYEGRDIHSNHIRFYYTRHGHMQNFRINHHVIGGAIVSGTQWHHTCHPTGFCTRGEWVPGRPANQQVRGYWHLNGSSGDAISWYAHWVPYYSTGNHGLF